MASLMGSYAAGYEAVKGVEEDISSKQTLREAYEQTPTDEGKESKDLFRVNSLAAQMAASRGDTRIADKFQKQADDHRRSEYTNQIKEIERNQAVLEQAEQKLQAIDTPEAAEELILSDKLLQPQQKLQMVSQLRSQGLDKFKDVMQKASITAKDRLTAEQRTLQMKQRHEEKLGDQQIKLEGIRTNALLRDKMIDLGYSKLEETNRHNQAMEDIRNEDSITRIDDVANKEIKQATRGKDPEEAAKITKKIKAAANKRKEELKGQKPGATGGGKESKDIPQSQISELVAARNNPKAIASFDSVYGKGAANEVLRRYDQENKK